MDQTDAKTFDETTVLEAARLLIEAAPGSTVILFGSYARNMQTPDSDLDFLVIEPNVRSPLAEMVRLRDVLRPLRISADVLVASQEKFDRLSTAPGTPYYDAANEGRIFNAVA
jgi:predicted nucleotidyltransferase